MTTTHGSTSFQLFACLYFKRKTNIWNTAQQVKILVKKDLLIEKDAPNIFWGIKADHRIALK